MATANVIRMAIFNVLIGDPELQGLCSAPDAIFHRTAPQDAVYPFVLLDKQSGMVDYTFGTGPSSMLEDQLWLVKGVDRDDSSAVAEALDERARALLQDAELVIEGYTPLWFRRESDLSYGEVEKGEMIHHVGALYRLYAQPL